MAETDAEIHYKLLYFIFPIIVASYLLYRLCRGKIKVQNAKFQAFICNCMCGYVHNRFCKKEKAILFKKMKDYKNQQKPNKTLTILEIGAGSGMNFNFFPSGSEITCLDPNPYNEKYLKSNISKATNHVKLVRCIKGFAENMTDISDNTFDAVVCTFTMCSIRDLNAAIKEIIRVLKPGGTFFFLEHVAAKKGSCIRFFQNKFQYIWPFFSGGCNLNRETWQFLKNSDFKETHLYYYSAPTWLGFFFRPGLYGLAVK